VTIACARATRWRRFPRRRVRRCPTRTDLEMPQPSFADVRNHHPLPGAPSFGTATAATLRLPMCTPAPRFCGRRACTRSRCFRSTRPGPSGGTSTTGGAMRRRWKGRGRTSCRSPGPSTGPATPAFTVSGPVAVRVTAWNGDSGCILTLKNVTSEQLLDSKTVTPRNNPVILNPDGSRSVYLSISNCDVKVSHRALSCRSSTRLQPPGNTPTCHRRRRRPSPAATWHTAATAIRLATFSVGRSLPPRLPKARSRSGSPAGKSPPVARSE